MDIRGSQLQCFHSPLILLGHLSVYFVTRRQEKLFKYEQISPQAAAEFAKEKKDLSENYEDNYNGFACMSFSPVYICIFWVPLF